MRRPYWSGNWRACDNTVMPPIEWPTNTTRPARRHRLQHGLQVLAQLGQRVGLGRGLTGLAVPALVVEDHPHARTPLIAQPHPLEMERAHAQTESVDEDHRHLRIHRAGLADRQRHPVGGGHDVTAIAVQRSKSSSA